MAHAAVTTAAPRLATSIFSWSIRTVCCPRPGKFRAVRRSSRNGGFFRCMSSISMSTQTSDAETSPVAASVKKRIVSGVQPTGSIHLGNYLGAIKNWVALQDTYETLFFIVDLHAITLPFDVRQLAESTRTTAALYLACGIDASKASIFVQSHVRAHLELMWLLSSASPIGRLSRMIQFKEKSRNWGDENVGVALLTYPVLMASDILLYQDVVHECKDMNWGTFKINLTDALINHLTPIQARYEEIISDASYLDRVLLEGATKASSIADATLNHVYQAMGFLQR